MKHTRMASLCLGLLALCGNWTMAEEASARMEPGIPVIAASPRAPSPLVDGALTDACWRTAAPIEKAHVLKSADQTRPISGWVGRDDAWLYVAIAIPHPSPKHIKRAITRHNGPVESDDSVELFIDPGTGGVLYFQFKLNAANVGAEKYVTRKGDQPTPGSIPWRSGAALTETGWSAEIAIPLAFLAAYGDLDKCRINLNVNLIIPKIDQYGVRVGEDREWLSWAPVRVGFHEPDRFGYVKGLAGPTIREPFFPQFSDLTVKPYRLVDKNYAYGLTMKVSSAFAQAGRATVVIIDRPVGGPPSVTTRTIDIAGRNAREINLTVPVTAMTDRTVELRVKKPETGEVFQSARLDAKDMAALNLMTCYLDRSYYTTEPEALAICEFSLPPEDLARMNVTVSGADKSFSSPVPASHMTRVALPLKDVPEGVTALQLELRRENGDKVAGQSAVLTKRAPAPGREWKIDRVNRVILRNGQPFFGFGIVVATFNEESARDIAATGLNHVCILGGKPNPEQALEHLRLAEKYGLYLIDYLNGYMTPNAPIEFRNSMPDPKIPEPERSRRFAEAYANKLALIRQVVKSQAGSPYVMGYFSIDEPGCSPEIPDMPRRGRDLYRAANEADGYHPLFVNFSSYINEGAEWTDWTDVLGTDPYWTPAAARHRGTPNFVSKITRMTDERARPNRQPTWIIPEAGYWSGNYKRPLRPQEQFCQTYLAIIHGAKCVTYFSQSTLIPRSNYDAIRELAGQMKRLGPAIVSPDTPQRIVYEPTPDKDAFPPIQATLRARPEGGYLLICANSEYYPVDATFRLKGLELKSDSVSELFAPDKIHPLKGNAFDDSLEPFGTRAYVIQARNAEINRQSPIEVAITTAGHPERVKAEAPESPVSGRPGKKNLAQNPSFEEMSVSTLPDYYFTAQDYHKLPPGRDNGAPNARYGCVTDRPYHGKYCVRLVGSKSPAQVRFRLAPKVDQPTRFTLSLYMRADRDGVQAGLSSLYEQVSLPGWTSASVRLSTRWQRVSITGVIPPGLSEWNQFVIFAPTENSTIWFDAIQLEKGEEPTEFEP